MNDQRRYVLWGGPLSVYTAKARSYLIKKQIPFIERFPSHPDFFSRIVPELGFFVIPVLETPDGELIEDTSAIIDHLEAKFPLPDFVPATPLQDLVATLICAFGSEGLNLPSMHYRWSFMEQHGDYIRGEFARALSTSTNRAERLAVTDGPISIMTDHLLKMGIVPETFAAIEKAYLDLLEALDEHFLHYPYLLGFRPSMADFGLMTGLFAHLSRDPVPSALMKAKAANVYRWTERMNLANIEDGEFSSQGTDYLADDAIPHTLEPVIAIIFRDWGPELSAYATRYNAWLAEQGDQPSGYLVALDGERAVHPNLGQVSYQLGDTTITRQSYPHSLWHFQKATTLARRLAVEDLTRWNALLSRTGGEQLMALTLERPLSRENNVLVLA